MRKMRRPIETSLGFTTIELAIVMAIIGILAAIALPGILKSLPEKRLKGVARNLYSDMQKARLLAVKHNTTVPVTFETTNGTYTYSYCNQFNASTSPTTPPVCANGGYKTVTLEKGVSYGSDGPEKINSNNCNWNNDPCTPAKLINFRYKGTADNGIIYLQNDNKNVCYAVSVSIYGYVQIKRFNGSKWE